MGDAATMQDADIYVKTDAGRDEIKSRALGLSMSIRAILLMIDGQRTVSAMRGIIAGSKAPPDVLDSLVAQGLIEPVAPAQPARPAPIATPVSVFAPMVPTPASPVAPRPSVAPVAPTPPAPAPVVSAPAPALADASTRLYDGPLDLTLPTIYGPEASAPTPPAPPVPLDAAPLQNRYEHLYAMMNDVVRDFLSPHRRYFFQLKIERCTTDEELLDLLNDLETALAKSRGEAFARDVIARLRGAAV